MIQTRSRNKKKTDSANHLQIGEQEVIGPLLLGDVEGEASQSVLCASLSNAILLIKPRRRGGRGCLPKRRARGGKDEETHNWSSSFEGAWK